jgi:hypothetical protein
MIPLPVKFHRDGFSCTFLKREGDVVVVQGALPFAGSLAERKKA